MTSSSLANRVACRYVQARDFATEKALEKYLHEHPQADRHKHHVVDHEEKGHGGEHEEGHGEHGEKHEGHSGGMFSRLKGALKSVAKQFKDAPKEVQKFIADAEHREKQIKKGLQGLKNAPTTYIKQLAKTAKHEVKEFKTAGEGIAAVLKGGKATAKQKHAMKEASTHMAITIAAAVLTTASPGLAVAAAGKALIKHIALKAATEALGDMHSLQELGHISHHGVLHVLEKVMERVAASQDDEDGEKPKDEELFAAFIMKHVAEQMKKLNDDTLAEGLGGGDDDGGDEGQQKQATVVTVAYAARMAKEFSSPGALRQYLHDHPQADPSKHYVRTEEGGLGSGAARTKVKVDKGLAGEISKIWKNKPSSNAVDKVRHMVEEGQEVSLNMLGQAVTVLKNEEQRAKGDDKRGLEKLRRQLQKHMHE